MMKLAPKRCKALIMKGRGKTQVQNDSKDKIFGLCGTDNLQKTCSKGNQKEEEMMISVDTLMTNIGGSRQDSAAK